MQPAIHASDFARLREQAGLSIEEVAEQTGFSARTVYRWDRGETAPRKAARILLENRVRALRSLKPASPAFRFIDLFAGIGGLRRGFEPLGGKCVFTSEWDRYAQLTYRANFDCDHEIAGEA